MSNAKHCLFCGDVATHETDVTAFHPVPMCDRKECGFWFAETRTSSSARSVVLDYLRDGRCIGLSQASK